MANIMKMLRLKNHVSRDGFDLQKSLAFSAKPGEFLPVYSRYMMPGDSFDLDTVWRTRTSPIETSAFTSFKEYFDWYFVPIDILWNKFNQWFTNNKNQVLSATSINGNMPLSDDHPYFTVGDLQQCVNSFRTNGDVAQFNAFGFDRAENLCKLLHYLGYGDYYTYPDDDSHDNLHLADHLVDYKLSPWRLLAYHCIYSHHIRYDQWEQIRPETFNIDYIDGSDTSLHIPITDIFRNNVYANGVDTSMLELQYVNWNKDLFMGLLPNSQFGDEATVDFDSIDYGIAYTGLTINQPNADVTTNNNGQLVANSSNSWTVTKIQNIAHALGVSNEQLSSRFSILALRRAEALQKYKEIKQSNKYDFSSQVDAHYGVRPSDAYSRLPIHIGGSDSVIGIADIDNTNIIENADGSYNAARVAGKVNSRGSGKQRHYETKVPGILMCCYHVKPILDYALPNIAPDNLKTKFTDYPIPEFDKTGMQQVPLAWLTNRLSPREGFTHDTERNTHLLGYAPAYIAEKTDFDEVKGAFYNGGLQSWVAPITAEYASNFLNYSDGGSYSFNGLTNTFFKVDPRVLNPIFVEDMDSSVRSDKFWVQVHFDINAVRPLDRQGLPY